jgi:cytochrome c biogenesis protein CcmG/thiol:disulfide interchange protein DsbE
MSTTAVPRVVRRHLRPSAPRGLRRRTAALGTLPLLILAAGCGSAPDTGSVSPKAPDGTASLPAGVTSPSLAPCPKPAPGPRVALPAVSLTCLGGGRGLSLDHLPARPFVINLWASWCAPCRAEAPRLAAAATAAYGHVEFLGVDTEDERDAALSFLADVGIDYPQLSDPGSDVMHRLPAPGIPVTLAVDATGRVVYRRIGEVSVEQLADAVHAADPTALVPAGGVR